MPRRLSDHIRTGLLLLVVVFIVSAYFFYSSPVVQEGFVTVFQDFDASPLWQRILLVGAIIIAFCLFVYAIIVSVSSQAQALTSGVRNVGTGVRDAGSGLGNWFRGLGEESRARANAQRASIARPPNQPSA